MALKTNSSLRVLGHPQAVAWTVVILSFAVFCVSCAAATYVAYWFFFQSPIALTAKVIASRGNVTVDPRDGTQNYFVNSANYPQSFISSNALLVTEDANSQGYISFQDNYSGRVVAKVFLLGSNSSLVFDEAIRPRFEWSGQRYTILLDDANGRFAVDISPGLNRDVMLIIKSSMGGVVHLEKAAPKGAAVHPEEASSYMIDSLDKKMTLYTESGTGFLYSAGSNAKQIDKGMQGEISDNQTAISVQPYPYIMVNLPDPGPIHNTFGEIDPTAAPQKIANRLPLGWACADEEPNNPGEPPAVWQPATVDERNVLRMVRPLNDTGNQTLGHAETGCEFWFPKNPDGLDISQYSSLLLRIKMNIHEQEVTTCGIRASECPVMLEIAYLDQQKNPQRWFQGFYAERPISDTNPIRCDTCPHDHEQIHKDAWYIYNTGDLRLQTPFDVPANGPKVYLQKIRLYASGHRFDVALGEVTILGKPVDETGQGK